MRTLTDHCSPKMITVTHKVDQNPILGVSLFHGSLSLELFSLQMPSTALCCAFLAALLERGPTGEISIVVHFNLEKEFMLDWWLFLVE